LPSLLGGALCVFVLYGFWYGLSLRPHEREQPAAVEPILLVGKRLIAQQAKAR
jgi:hypothetical protein